MATRLLYLEDFDVVDCDAVVRSVGTHEDGRTIVVLDQTCFYPRGGGQDWDTGLIETESVGFRVEEVRLDETGEVLHIGTMEQGKIAAGAAVRGAVDAERRTANTRLHSAGHVIDWAMSDLNADWLPGRGAHYPHMSFVEYTVPEGAGADEAFVCALQNRIDTLLAGRYDNKVMIIDKSEMQRYCRHVTDNIPSNKPSRIVLYADDFGIPCGGTHVRTVGDIGQLRITKIKIKHGLGKVSYAVDGIN